VGTLRRFGERCIVQVPREIRKKADFTEMKGEPAVFLGQSEGISGWIVMMDKDGSITHSRDIRMTPHALSRTPPHREAEERSPPRLPIVELGPTSSDADDELGRETATEGQPVAMQEAASPLAMKSLDSLVNMGCHAGSLGSAWIRP